LSDERAARYNITFLGPVQNDLYHVNKLSEGLKKHFKISDEAIAKVMKMAPVVIKKEATLSEAQQYKKALEAIGAKVQLEPIVEASIQEAGAQRQQELQSPSFHDREPQFLPVKEKLATASPESPATEVETQMVTCPQCGCVQDKETDECIRCGVVISKFLKYREQAKSAGVESANQSHAAKTRAAGPKRSKIFGAPALFILILVWLAVVSLWAYYSPYRTLNKIREAAEKEDMAALQDLIDFPSVRESLKEQFKSKIIKKMEVELKDNPFASFGTALVNNLIDSMVDACVTPEGISHMVKGIEPKFNRLQDHNVKIDNEAEGNTENKISKKYRYVGLSKFIASLCIDEENLGCISLILWRDGLKWKLTAVQLPESIFQEPPRPAQEAGDTAQADSAPGIESFPEQRIRGVGQTATERFHLSEGLYVVYFSHKGEGHFGVWLLRDTGDRVELLANDTDDCEGSKAMRVPYEGEYLLNVDAGGSWEIKFASPVVSQQSSVFSGTHQSATSAFQLKGGLKVFQLKHSGSGHFGVWLLDRSGRRVELLANTTGPFSGSKAIKADTGWYILDVSADGYWSITVE
jgi:hypothetical protein